MSEKKARLRAPEQPALGPIQGPEDWLWPSLCAHRGAGRLAPENTLAALRKGGELGARMAEVDVKLSKDEVCFLMHDDRLERCSSGRGRACLKTWEQLSALDAGLWHSKEHRGERMPSLEMAAAFLIERGMAVNLEIKPCPGRDEATGRAVALLSKSLWSASHPPPLLSSFSRVSLQAAREADPEAALALLSGGLERDDIAFAKSVGALAIHLNGNRGSFAEAQAVKEAGLRLAYYTINETDLGRKLLSWGADCLITDQFEKLSAELGPELATAQAQARSGLGAAAPFNGVEKLG